MERGSDKLAWFSPGTLVRGQNPHNRQTFIAGTRKLLGTTTPNHSVGLGPQAAGEWLGDHRGGGGEGMKRRACRQVGEMLSS